jgi:hypothetical protein
MPETKKGVKRPRRKALSEQTDLVKVVYYGESGTGKTTALAGFARLGKVLFVNAESGVKQKPLRKLGIPVENIEVFDDITFEALEQLYFDLKGELHDDPEAYAAVVLDSITEIQKKMMESVMADAILKAERKGVERDRFAAYTEDWGQLTGMTRGLIRGFRDLPCHVGFSALARRDQDDDGVVVYGPDMTPKVQGDLKGYVDVGCYLRVQNATSGGEKEEYTGVFRPVGKFWAKDRFNSLPRVLMDPSADRVYDYVTGKYDARTTAKAAKDGITDGEGVDPIQAAWRIRVASATKTE